MRPIRAPSGVQPDVTDQMHVERGTGTDRGTGSAGSELAYTGGSLTAAMLGLVVLAGGLSLMVLGRRRGDGLG